MDKTRFLGMMTSVAAIYNTNMSEFLMDMYYSIFKNYDYEQFKKAMTKVVMSHKYNTFPKPAEIIEYLDGSKDDKAMIAWMEAKKAVKQYGYYSTVQFKDPIISHCLKELGGWMEFCSAKIDDLPFIEKRFLDLYRLFLKREITKPVKMFGFLELSNTEKGYKDHIPEPCLVGYEENDNKQIDFKKDKNEEAKLLEEL